MAACAPNTALTDTPAVDQPIQESPVIGEMPTSTPLIPKSGGSFSNQEPTQSPLDELQGEDEMIRGEVFVDSQEILLMESFPVQVALQVSGSLPTPCHMLRAEVSEPDSQNNIHVELWSLSEPDVVCVQVVQAFETSIPLGSYPEGDYTVHVNGEKAGEFSI
jgi:inhibitor of cysteine peptidase